MQWSKLSDEELLGLRIRDLDLKLEDSDVYPWVQKVFEEMRAAGLTFSPRIYFGDEWFSPEGLNAVAIPFFLAHPRLRELERKFMLDCEGDIETKFQKLFRHELGHAFDHNFKVSKRRLWIKIFGSPKKEYRPETYRPRPYSKNFVDNIGGGYAQAHPDEDFAETFAVWLDPHSNWKMRYRKWGAYKKLQYVDKLALEFNGKTAWPPIGRMISDARYLTSTLKHYYEKKRRSFAEEYPDFYDKDLLKIFARSDECLSSKSAARFLRQNQKAIIQSMAHWTGERKATVGEIFKRIAKRADVLSLKIPDDESRVLLDLAAFFATLLSHYLLTGHFRRNLRGQTKL
jgi:hypothetical protein